MWRVDLSDVTASMLESGEMAMLKTNAGSTPRRSSATFVQFDVEKTRIKVPVSLAVANSCPSELRSIARNGDVCAGMMLTLPELSSTIWTFPGDRPGNATILEPKQHSPRVLSAVSNTDVFSGGDENLYRWTLF